MSYKHENGKYHNFFFLDKNNFLMLYLINGCLSKPFYGPFTTMTVISKIRSVSKRKKKIFCDLAPIDFLAPALRFLF